MPSANAKILSSSDKRVWVDGRLQLRTLWKLLFRLAELAVCLGPALLSLVFRQVPLVGGLCCSRERLLSSLVASLARCGPVGIKWGQWASTRYDLFEDDFCLALDTLTNSAPEHSFAHTKETVERSFDAPLRDIFVEFDEACIASGSIGQVHVATLRSDGARVAVKVQHPNLPERLALDMTILRRVADLGGWLLPDWRIGETAEQFACNFESQLDFEDEGRNLRNFGANFGSLFWSALVSFPRPVEGLIAHDVIVESFEEGESVARFLNRNGDAAVTGEWYRDPRTNKWKMRGQEEKGTSDDELLRTNIAVCGVQSYLKMLIWDNMIHADLHPGNVLIRMEEIGLLARLQRLLVLGDFSPRVPHIILLDAGLAASFHEGIFSNVRSFFDAIIRHDGEEIGWAILGLSPTQPHVASPEAFVAETAAKCAAQKEAYEAGAGNSSDNIREYMESVRAHRVVLDPTVMVALMSMMVLEGWQARLDPATSVMDCIESATGGGIFGYVSQAGAFFAELRAKVAL